MAESVKRYVLDSGEGFGVIEMQECYAAISDQFAYSLLVAALAGRYVPEIVVLAIDAVSDYLRSRSRGQK